MRALVAGAAGFLGQAAVRALSQGGWHVRGMVRNPAQFAAVVRSGGEPILGDVSDASHAEKAARGCDAILHLAISSAADPSSPLGRIELDRSRVQGARNLVAAARAQHVPRLVLGSGYWLYGDHPGIITEASESHPSEVVEYNWKAEQVVHEAHQSGLLDGIIVRPSMVYGDGSWFRPMFDGIRDGTYRYIEDGSNHWSLIHRADCGEAFRCIVDRGRGGETYIAADDEPVPIRTFAEFVAQGAGAPRPKGIPFAVAAKVFGESASRALRANQAVSNQRLRSLGWVPTFPNYRVGIAPAVREMSSRSAEGSRA